MGRKGLEPLTLRLSGVYSYQLSYSPHTVKDPFKEKKLRLLFPEKQIEFLVKKMKSF